MSTPLQPLDSFDSFALSAPVQEAMKDMGFTAPTPIQQRALPILLENAGDFIGLAATGTGKTAAFGIPLIEGINTETKDTQALVLSPTRELALQVAEQLTLLGKKKGVRVVTIYGGANYRPQIEGIKRGAHIIVATPGRLVDFIDQKYIKLQNVKTVVLDEADEMLSMGFKDDLETILGATHNEESTSGRAACRTWLFSATMNKEVSRLTENYLESPQMVQADKTGETAKTIEQIYYTVMNRNKTEALCRLLQTIPDFYGIIFCQTKMEVAELAETLANRGFATDSLHGDKSQAEREMTLKKFKARQVTVIVATDVAARGLDIKDLTHVVNHSLPWDSESYVHRIGRTGRNGQKGVALTLVDPNQLNLLRRVMVHTKAQLTKGKVPSSDEVAGFKIKEVLEKIAGIDETSFEVGLARDFIVDLAQSGDVSLNGMKQEDILAKMIVAFFPHILVKKDMPLDYMGDRIPRELLPRDPKDNRFTRGREDSRGPRSGGNRRFDRGGERAERGERSDRGGERSERGGFRGQRSSGFRAERGERSDRGGFRAEGGERTERSASDRGGFRAERPERGERSERPEHSERRPRQDAPGVKRHRSSTKSKFSRRPSSP